MTIGDPLISPSSSSHLKSCCSQRYLVAADAGAVRANSAAMNASTCSRRMLATAVGMALTCEERGQESAVVGISADGPRRQVGRLQVEALGRQECGKLSYAGTGICLSHKDRLDAVPALCTT